MAQKLEEASRFPDADIAQYKALNMNYAKNPNPSSTEDLLKFQELILLDIRFLAGCDIRWDHRIPLERTLSSAAAADAADATDAAETQPPATQQPPAG